jgi:hypothetical protein
LKSNLPLQYEFGHHTLKPLGGWLFNAKELIQGNGRPLRTIWSRVERYGPVFPGNPKGKWRWVVCLKIHW